MTSRTLVVFLLVGCGGQEIELSSGIFVTFGVVNNPGPELVETWTEDVKILWGEKYLHEVVSNSLVGHSVEFIDKELIEIDDRLAYGYTIPGYSAVGTSSVESLFKHEVGHVVLDGAGVPWDEEIHHEMMKGN